MIKRHLVAELLQLAKEYPIVTVLGPRQAGKTTLVKNTLRHFDYCNLEDPEKRAFAAYDPKSFLSQFKNPAILDEIQRVPQLLSYLQIIVDERGLNGQFIITGSHQFKLQLREGIFQSLAGRTAILNLLPFSISELKAAQRELPHFSDYAMNGFLPRVYDQNQRPEQAYANYYQTYVERDVRQLINLKDVSLFEKFMKLLAGRVGQLFDHTSMGNDVGVDAKTIRSWLSILEASYIIFKLPPYFENFGKRVTKSPKYYFVDVGLLCFLLGIQNSQQLSRDPLIGNIFENLIVIDCLKERLNQGKQPNLYFFRDSAGNEVDLLIQSGRDLDAIEIKSTATFSPALLGGLQKFSKTSARLRHMYLVYNGDSRLITETISAKKFDELSDIFGV